MNFIHPDTLKEVAFICTDVQTTAGSFRKEIATCFLVNMFLEGDRRFKVTYIVTAKHALQGVNPKAMFLRVNDPRGGVHYIKIAYPWHFHSDPAVDLAVALWGDPDDDYDGPTIMTHTFNFDKIVRHLATWIVQGMPWPPPIGSEIILIGLLPHQPGTARNTPIVRFGTIAMITEEKVEGPCGSARYHLANLQTYPGHSGGPVYYATGTQLNLLGVMSGGYPSEIGSAARKRAPKDSGLPDKVFNLGVSLITPVEQLVELLMSDELKDERKKIQEQAQDATKPKVEPTSVDLNADDDTFTAEDFLNALKKVSRKQPDEEKS